MYWSEVAISFPKASFNRSILFLVLVRNFDLFHNNKGFVSISAKPVPERNKADRKNGPKRSRFGSAPCLARHHEIRHINATRARPDSGFLSVRNLKQRQAVPLFVPDRKGLPVTAFVHEMNVKTHRADRGQLLDGQHIEHHVDIAHRIDVTVEVDVAVNHPVLHHMLRCDPHHLAGFLRRRRGIDERIGTRPDNRVQVDRFTDRQVDDAPLRHGPPELPASGIVQREITGREHPVVLVHPRYDFIRSVLFGAVVDLDRHARKDPRAVFLIQLIDPEPFALGIDTRRIEDLVRQSRNGHPKCEIDLLRVCIISVTCFLCHISVRFSISNDNERQSRPVIRPGAGKKAVDTEWFIPTKTPRPGFLRTVAAYAGNRAKPSGRADCISCKDTNKPGAKANFYLRFAGMECLRRSQR